MTAGGTVAQLWRHPVKSMGGERVHSAPVGPEGLLGDRALAVVDAADGTVATAKFPRDWAGLLGFTARYHAEPVAGRVLPPVEIRFPDGSMLRSDDEKVHVALSEVLGREVVLAVGGPFVDLAAAHLLTAASVASAAALLGEPVDVRRLRPTVLLEGADDAGDAVAGGWPEDGWLGRTVRLGEGDAAVQPFLPTPRCVMTTLPQPDLPQDGRLLAALTREHRRTAGEYGVRPCLGVYAEVTGEGTVTEGDPWRLECG